MTNYGFIGAGNMGSILLRALVKQVPASAIYVVDPNASKVQELHDDLQVHASTPAEIAQKADYIFMAVKPYLISQVAQELDSLIPPDRNPVLISMAAGVAISTIEENLRSARPVLRIMPNTAALVGEGMIQLCSNQVVEEEQVQHFINVMQSAGKIELIDEKLIDAAGALSGCGPAYVYLFAEALADAGVECGLTRSQAYTFAAQTIVGAGKMILETGQNPAALKDAVCSPGGTTIAGVHALERGGFRAAAMDAVLEAYKKSLK